MKSSPKRFAAACGVFSLAPLLVLLEGDTAAWRRLALERGWEFLAPEPAANLDARLKALETRLRPAEREIYLAGQGEGASAVFYAVSRLPGLWSAAVALGGSPRPAIESNRLFGANAARVPLLWIAPQDEELAKPLRKAGFLLDYRRAQSAQPQEVLDWLSVRRRDPYPDSIDCETGTPAYARCYWIEMTRFDPAQRNDVLESTRVAPSGSGARLDLALKPGDRVVAVGGKAVADERELAALLAAFKEEKPVVVMVERGKERQRVEARVVIPPRPEAVTARVQARYLPDGKEILIVSRAVAGMRVAVPEAWAPAALNWNGTELGKAESGGCWLLEENQQLLSARPCP